VSLKLGAAATIVALLLAERALPPVALAAGLAVVIAATVFLERLLIPPREPVADLTPLA
jgi:hypothetical protein